MKQQKLVEISEGEHIVIGGVTGVGVIPWPEATGKYAVAIERECGQSRPYVCQVPADTSPWEFAADIACKINVAAAVSGLDADDG